jgi:hypothetical protein
MYQKINVFNVILSKQESDFSMKLDDLKIFFQIMNRFVYIIEHY